MAVEGADAIFFRANAARTAVGEGK